MSSMLSLSLRSSRSQRWFHGLVALSDPHPQRSRLWSPEEQTPQISSTLQCAKANILAKLVVTARASNVLIMLLSIPMSQVSLGNVHFSIVS